MPPKDGVSREKLRFFASGNRRHGLGRRHQFRVLSVGTSVQPRTVKLPPAQSGRVHPLDRILDTFEGEKAHIPHLSARTFARRAYLDLIGFANPEQLNNFIKDDSPDKRAKLIELLSEDVSYADHWLTFWNDLLRNDYTVPDFTGGRKQITT